MGVIGDKWAYGRRMELKGMPGDGKIELGSEPGAL